MLPDDSSKPRPLFFLSYARSGIVPPGNGPLLGSNGNVVRFFNDLSRCVVELVDRIPGADPGFMDRSIQGGRRWTDQLLRAVGNCQVFVALLSNAYVSSEWCGMEWDAFSRREVGTLEDGASPDETCIIPVTWAPVSDKRLPTCVLAVQRFSPAELPNPVMEGKYEAEGIFGLLQLGLDTCYSTVVWRLAQQIRTVYYSHTVEPCTFKRTELRNIFDEKTDTTFREQDGD